MIHPFVSYTLTLFTLIHTQTCSHLFKPSNITSKEDSHTIFRDAAALNMTESGYVWIVTEQALNANNTPDGVIGLQLVHAKSEKNHIRVSICK